jgi:hypothetical protein
MTQEKQFRQKLYSLGYWLGCRIRRLVDESTSIRAVLLQASAVLAVGPGVTIEATAQTLTLSPAGSPETVFSWQRDACDRDDIPDAPARAFRDAGGTVHLLATHFVNREFTGASIDTVRRDCRIVMRGGEQARPELFDDRGWLAATFTADGRTVFALVHDEFQGHRHPPLCPTGRYIDCWYNAITMAESRDGGSSFTLLDRSRRLVAALPYPYDPDRRKHIGYFNPTNIIERDGYLYAMVFAEAVGEQKHGSCLIRTNQIADPNMWRGWDGHDFTVTFADPYDLAAADGSKHVCDPVGNGNLRWPVTSIVRHLPSGLTVALMMGSDERATKESGIFYSVSADLIKWSEPRLLMGAAAPNTYRCGDTAPIAYPSLIDPASPGRNFDAASEEAEVLATRFNVNECRTSMDRDLVRQRVHLVLR